MPRKIEISHKTIIFTVGFLFSLWFVYTVRDIIFQIFVALLIMSILNPTVTRLHKLKVPRAVSVIIVYIAAFGFISIAIAAMVPALIEQTTNFANSLPQYLEDLKIPVVVVDQITKEVTSQLGTLPSQILRIAVSVFSNFIAVVTVFIFALYFLLARENMETQMASFFSDKHSKMISRIVDTLEKKLGGWARAQLMLMVLVGASTYVGLLVLGIPFALPLALLAGILEIIPNIGPFLAAIPAVIVGLGISPLTGLAVGALGFLIQQTENYIFLPKIMQKSVGVSPIITLVALVVGFRFAGVAGAIVSVPVVITAQVVLSEYFSNKNN